MTHLIEVKNVTKIFSSGLLKRDVTLAVDNATLMIEDDCPSITAIAGESGSGKTTLALMLMGQVAPDAGQVFYRGKDLAKMTHEERKRMRREVQPIYQDPFAAYNPFYRVDHVLQMPIRHFGLAKSKQEASQRISEALERVGLRPAETLGRFPHQLSGGQRQRLMVARALLCQPKVIIADEPVSMVDASLRATILASLRKLNQELGISIIYITHDLTTAYQICKDIVIMYAGAVVESGSVDQVIREPKHPYTRLLIASIPLPDKRARWGGAARAEDVDADRKPSGCMFANRCPHAMEHCWANKPSLYQVDQGHAAACFLYQDSPIVAAADAA